MSDNLIGDADRNADSVSELPISLYDYETRNNSKTVQLVQTQDPQGPERVVSLFCRTCKYKLQVPHPPRLHPWIQILVSNIQFPNILNLTGML